MAQEINLTASTEDRKLITEIVERAGVVFEDSFDATSASMDITATHLNGTPLDLIAFLNADEFNFRHDFAGIIKHMNRNTGKLNGLFEPRFSR